MADQVGAPILAGNTQMQFTGEFLNKRRLIRSQKNHLDKCTVVSIFPRVVEAIKETIEPGHFIIPPGTYEKPATLVVGSSSWWKDVDVEQPMIEIPVGSIQVANSIVNDYCNSIFGCNMSDATPGLFFVQGEKKPLEIKTEFKQKLDEMKAKQDRWYTVLVREADSTWARSNNNPIVIWDIMRLAARSLNLNDKPWLKDFQIAELIRCNFCGGMRNPLYPICPVCKAIDPTHVLAKDIKFAV